uniref:hypothetical protein 7 n=1 Tax=Moniliophthora perniciosa TaxID=153609 RepID=UPI0000242340|nr:hypothetical protein 7 [Moniliophthora perniciosa]AAQ74297.1 hypothetical protein 7 [Moniliophthora perniciosa]
MTLNYIIDLFNSIGISVNTNNPIVLFLVGVCVLAVICLWCFLTIVIYFITIYISEHEYFLSKLPNWVFLHKFITYFKTIRYIYIIFEILLFLFCILYIIISCMILINDLS